MPDPQPIGAPVTLSLPRPRPPRTPMQGQYGSVIPTTPEHAAALHAAFVADTEARDWTYLPYGPFASEPAFAEWLTTACLAEDPLFHTICAPDGTALGLASYLRIDPANGVIEVGHIHFAPALQRTPLATEAMALMMARAFDELGYRRYEWKCDALNAPSRRAAQRLGFTYEGTFRQATVVKGRNRDTAWFSVLDTEWPAIKARFSAWLEPGNFDASGRQITPLR
ncbi:GNAT family N-acetyltransferase [Puniceibacterium sediminis]|uniref:Protein N-acetyltransferase, RimJ/RimL family n=1 Tax=Puniceibacterium sediminis TaxID=1608407 RepID=A0A238VJN8_9RHOB|nr:GNAT family protein [Puniceibacterium sediminis]SNR34394.1 Protein N-acetyltransferase, RimJ/RimL family [Puniceibacterium sediminis]